MNQVRLSQLQKYHLTTFKTFYAKPAQKGTDTQVELKSFTVVREVLHIITDLAIPLVLTTFGE